jgi:hypothetical protein
MTMHELEKTLTEAFETARTGAQECNNNPSLVPLYLTAMGTIGQALVAIETEQREAKAERRREPLPFPRP